MAPNEKLTLALLRTGVPGLDEVLGGGLPQYSFNLVAGPPGSGKTTLVHQLVFSNATADRPALYFTVLGEPALKMLRYQQQMDYFDAAKVGTAIRFVDLGEQVLAGDLAAVLAKIEEEVKGSNPAIVAVDSFRSVVRALERASPMDPAAFLQQLAMHLATWQVTSFLIGEYVDDELQDNPVFTIADGILWLTQHTDRNSVVRKLQVMKIRGRAAVPGLHTFRITSRGVQVFARTTSRVSGRERFLASDRTNTGVPGLDALLGGGLPTGDATIVAGPSGTGKTVISSQFIAEGMRHSENGVLAVFEEHPDDYLARASKMGFDLQGMVRAGRLKVINLRPLDLSTDEVLQEIQQSVSELDAKRLVIDSINGLEVSLAPNFREDFRESLYRMVSGLTGGGVSVLLTVEVMESFNEIRFSPHDISFLAQNIIVLRYAEIEGELRKVLGIIKMRNSGHSRELHGYEITATGMRILLPLDQFEGVLTGVPRRRAPSDRPMPMGVTNDEAAVLERLIALQQATPELLQQGGRVDGEDFARVVDRLVDLGYVVRVDEGGRVLLRAGAGIRRR
jgi:circadian clock protein KaiC